MGDLLARLPRMLRHRSVVVFLQLGVVGSCWALHAQCPDGSAAPCGHAPRAPPANSVAVLVFDNLARDTAVEYLGEGLAEQIGTSLERVGRLEVKSAALVRHLQRMAGGDLRQIAELLRVRYIVEGSYQRSGGRLRVTARLVVAQSGSVRWADAFDGAANDVLAIQDSVAAGVALGVVGALAPADRAALMRHPTVDREAYDLYLHGRFFFERGTDQDLYRALDLYGKALAKDSNFALAHVGISLALLFLDYTLPPWEVYSRARAEAQRALALDSTLAEAHIAMAAATLPIDHDFAGAERQARRAIALDPRGAYPHSFLMVVLFFLGQPDQALLEARRAWALDSTSDIIREQLPFALHYTRRYDEDLTLTRRLEPEIPDLRSHERMVLVRLGRCGDALTVPREPGEVTSDIVAALACLGRMDEARAARDSLRIRAARKRYYPAHDLARAEIAVGNVDEAFRLLDRAYDEGSFYIMNLELDPSYDPIRSDPRFAALVRRIGLPEKPER